MTLREYYIVKQIPILEGKKYSKGFSLLKYTDSNKQGSEVGKVYQLKDGSFISDDSAFNTHQNEFASRRVRIVKTHLEIGEPKFSVYWMTKTKVEHFKV